MKYFTTQLKRMTGNVNMIPFNFYLLSSSCLPVGLSISTLVSRLFWFFVYRLRNWFEASVVASSSEITDQGWVLLRLLIRWWWNISLSNRLRPLKDIFHRIVSKPIQHINRQWRRDKMSVKDMQSVICNTLRILFFFNKIYSHNIHANV